jgi:hypothetical protein
VPGIGGVALIVFALQHQHFWMFFYMRDEWVDLQCAELPSEVDVLRRGDLLITEEDHLVLD